MLVADACDKVIVPIATSQSQSGHNVAGAIAHEVGRKEFQCDIQYSYWTLITNEESEGTVVTIRTS